MGNVLGLGRINGPALFCQSFVEAVGTDYEHISGLEVEALVLGLGWNLRVACSPHPLSQNRNAETIHPVHLEHHLCNVDPNTFTSTATDPS